MYTYYDDNKWWSFNHGDLTLICDEVGIIFEQGDGYDVLIEHGPYNVIKQMFDFGPYTKLIDNGCKIFIVKVDPKNCTILNKGLTYPTSKYYTQILDSQSVQ